MTEYDVLQFLLYNFFLKVYHIFTEYHMNVLNIELTKLVQCLVDQRIQV